MPCLFATLLKSIFFKIWFHQGFMVTSWRILAFRLTPTIYSLIENQHYPHSGNNPFMSTYYFYLRLILLNKLPMLSIFFSAWDCQGLFTSPEFDPYAIHHWPNNFDDIFGDLSLWDFDQHDYSIHVVNPSPSHQIVKNHSAINVVNRVKI